ncbi:hypothetical protein [Solidesulfovibrio sp.]
MPPWRTATGLCRQLNVQGVAYLLRLTVERLGRMREREVGQE